jgi:hypothetical protein
LLVDLWSSVLQLASIGIHDDFLEIGGDSRLAIEIVARAPSVGLKGLDVLHILAHRTIAEIAPLIDASR